MKDNTPNIIKIKVKGCTGITYYIYIENNDISVEELKEKISEKMAIPTNLFDLTRGGIILDEKNKLSYYGIDDESTIYCIEHTEGGGGGYYFQKEINIKFIKDPKDINKSYFSIFCENQSKEELYGLLKLCFLKEISLKLDKNQIKKLPESISYILEILKNGYIATGPKEDIKKF